MSAVPADVLNGSSAARYQAPAAQLSQTQVEEFPDRWHRVAGRLGIRAFAWRYTTILLMTFAGFIAMFYAMDGIAAASNSGGSSSMFSILIAVVSMAIVLYSFFLGIVVQVKRFHDMNASGLFVLLGFIPYVGSIVLVALFLIRGKKDSNKYGAQRELSRVDKVLGTLLVCIYAVVAILALVGMTYLVITEA